MTLKNKIFLLIVLLAFSGAAFAQSANDPAELQDRAARVNKEIARLEIELSKAQTTTRKRQLQFLLKDMEQSSIVLNRQLALAAAKKEPVAVTQEVTGEISAPPQRIPAEVVKAGKRFTLEIGGTIGLFSGTTGLLGEVRLPTSFIIGPAKAAFRLSAGLFQNPDMTRRYVPVCLDGIWNFPPGWFSGVDNYFGAGINYVAMTTGRTSGSYGGQVFYGVQSEGFGGELFGEIGYAIMRTGFSPSQRGTTVMAGYRAEFSY